MQLQLTVAGQCMLGRHEHIRMAHSLRIQIGSLHAGHLTVLIAAFSGRITAIGAERYVVNGAHGLVIVLINLVIKYELLLIMKCAETLHTYIYLISNIDYLWIALLWHNAVWHGNALLLQAVQK